MYTKYSYLYLMFAMNCLEWVGEGHLQGHSRIQTHTNCKLLSDHRRTRDTRLVLASLSRAAVLRLMQLSESGIKVI